MSVGFVSNKFQSQPHTFLSEKKITTDDKRANQVFEGFFCTK